MYNKIFNTNVKRIMKEKDLNKSELAKLSGISYSFLADLIEGTGNPSLRVMETLAKALNMPIGVVAGAAGFAALEGLYRRNPPRL
jgi:transcriptional regulator with XRE-family HTH domain